mmetsp:Transcript_1419/g.2547  ORF Transcript_1419/g.2547 Transcript_1419/m.2547 type:complete len:234 (-) Transcript_1419:319-1020(-)
MQKKTRKLQGKTGIEDGFCHLSDSTGNKQAGRNHSDNRSKGKDGLNKFGEPLVERHTNGNGSEHNLACGHGDSGGIDRDDSSKKGLAQGGGHEDGTDGSGSGHEDGKSDVSFGDVGAKVGGLSTIDTSDEDKTGLEGGVEAKGSSETQGQEGHHGITKGELHNDRVGPRRHLDEITGLQSDSHGKHESRQCRRKVLRGKPRKGFRRLERNPRKDDRPKRKEVGSNIGRLSVHF